MERKARVHYVAVLGIDGYAIEIYKNGEWILYMFYPDMNGYIHIGIITTLSILKGDGYEVSYEIPFNTKGSDEK